jgi:hypothetical protein
MRATFVESAGRMDRAGFVSQRTTAMLDSFSVVLIVSQGVSAPERIHARVAAETRRQRSALVLANQEIH